MGFAAARSRPGLTAVRTGWHRRTPPELSRSRSPTTLDPTLRAAVVALRPDLLVLARRMCASEADAADVVHDTLESALSAGARLGAVENLRAWLVTILHRRVIDLFRRREREQLGDPPEEPAVTQDPVPADAPLWARVDTAQLRTAVERLEPEFRQAFVLHAFEERSYREIADALGIPLGTVGTRLLRARRKLRVLLLGGPEEVGT
jgi:RNA polymerase sigma-70 factor (ECF subfamily)